MARKGTPVPAPPARPPRFGLLQAAVVDTDSTLRWEAGFTFNPESCTDGGVYDPCSPGVLTPAECRENIDTMPFGVWAGVKRSTAGLDLSEARARARRSLEATQSWHIARELLLGEQALASGWPNQRLTDPDSDTITDGAVSPVDALACLEQYLGQCATGQQGMIHASRQVVTHWVKDYLVTRQGGQLVTALDTIVVADAGYDGSGPGATPVPPADGAIWAYATGIVTVRLGPVEALPPEGDQAAYTPLSNDVAVFAQRLAGVAWDGCCHGAAQIDLDVCAIGGAG